MSANNTRSTIIDILEPIHQRYVSHLPLIITILGVIGFLGNALTFLQANLRWVPFCIYTLCGSLIDTINIFVNLFSVYLNPIDGNLVVGISIRSQCKFKLFSLVFLPQFSMNLLILSLIDRYASTFGLRSSIQKIFRPQMIPWLIIITAILTCLITIYSPILYDIDPILGCVSTRPIIDSTLYIIIHGILTPSTMLILVFLTYRRLKNNRQRARAMLLRSVQRFRNQLIIIVFAQTFITSVFTLQWCIVYWYISLTQYNQRNSEEKFIIHFISFISNSLYYLINVRSFYLSTLISPVFRSTTKLALTKLLLSTR